MPSSFEEYKHLLYEEGKLDKKFKNILIYNSAAYRYNFFIQKGHIENQKWSDGYFITALLDSGLVVFIRDSVTNAANIDTILVRNPHYIYIGEGLYHNRFL